MSSDHVLTQFHGIYSCTVVELHYNLVQRFAIFPRFAKTQFVEGVPLGIHTVPIRSAVKGVHFTVGASQNRLFKPIFILHRANTVDYAGG